MWFQLDWVYTKYQFASSIFGELPFSGNLIHIQSGTNESLSTRNRTRRISYRFPGLSNAWVFFVSEFALQRGTKSVSLSLSLWFDCPIKYATSFCASASAFGCSSGPPESLWSDYSVSPLRPPDRPPARRVFMRDILKAYGRTGVRAKVPAELGVFHSGLGMKMKRKRNAFSFYSPSVGASRKR